MAKNVAASVHQKLLNKAKSEQRPFNELLQYFVIERFLYRLSQSQHAERFVLKGALLFRVWTTQDSRATRDIDFLAYGDSSIENLTSVSKSIMLIKEEDGLVFDTDSVRAQRIKEDADYEGTRVICDVFLGKAVSRLQLDIAFGDVVHPEPTKNKYPTILDHPAPILRLYPPETVFAEKLQAMIHFGAMNSRMKDFYDLWRFRELHTFDSELLIDSVRKTFSNRSTEAIRFSDVQGELIEAGNKQRQWAAFLKKSDLSAPLEFREVLDLLQQIVSPVLDAVANESKFAADWIQGESWRLR